MNVPRLKIVIFGLSITSSWGNGHATTYRGLIRELVARGHDVLFLERDVPWYAANRDPMGSIYGRIRLYRNRLNLKKQFEAEVRQADFVMVGSYVPEGVEIGDWVLGVADGVTGFYDIDTPVTLAKLERGEAEYVSAELISRYHLYLSFTGGPILRRLEKEYQSPMARALYCSVDPLIYYPERLKKKWDLGYLGTYCSDRQPTLDRLMLRVAHEWNDARLVVAGSQYPDTLKWPPCIERIDHLTPSMHREFYNQQRFTLNVTRANMVQAGYSPSVRLFEAAACGTPVISDYWEGIDHFFEIGREILIANSTEETSRYLRDMPERERLALGRRARARVLAEHTAAHRAVQLEAHILELLKSGLKSHPRRGGFCDRKLTCAA